MEHFKNFVVLDTETAGLEKTDQVIELGIVSEKGEVLYHSFFKPDVPIHPKAQEVHGIPEASLEEAPKFITEWHRIAKILVGKNIVGHNIIDFDMRLISQTLCMQDGGDAICQDLVKKCYDTYRIAKFLGYQKKSQQALMQRFGISKCERHRAIDDAIDLLHILPFIDAAMVASNYNYHS